MKRMSARPASARQRVCSVSRSGAVMSRTPSSSLNCSTSSTDGWSDRTVGMKAAAATADSGASAPTSSVVAPAAVRWRTAWSIDHQAVRLAARHAELVLVDALEGEALVELERAFEIAAEFRPAHRKQPHLDAPAGLDAGDQPREAPPASLELEKPRCVQDRVELRADCGIDLGDVAVDGGAQARPAGGEDACQLLAEPRAQPVPAAQPAVQERRQLGRDHGTCRSPK